MSSILYGIGSAMFGVSAAVAILGIRQARKKPAAKLESALSWLMLCWFGMFVGTLGILAGWDFSYPTHRVNGHVRSEAPASGMWAGILVMLGCLLLCGLTALVRYKIRERRLAPARQAFRQRFRTLAEEFGSDSPRIMEILDRTGVLDDMRRAENEGR